VCSPHHALAFLAAFSLLGGKFIYFSKQKSSSLKALDGELPWMLMNPI